jgi:hypothetical protein
LGERARWRHQALGWLRQDFAWWGKNLDNGPAQIDAEIRWRLKYWQADHDLAGVRAKDALARLPDDERKQWERLWSDVEALLRRHTRTDRWRPAKMLRWRCCVVVSALVRPATLFKLVAGLIGRFSQGK